MKLAVLVPLTGHQTAIDNLLEVATAAHDAFHVKKLCTVATEESAACCSRTLSGTIIGRSVRSAASKAFSASGSNFTDKQRTLLTAAAEAAPANGAAFLIL
ncbi:hypothetical protein [Citricoccus sp. NR2]|uniref:hypothetical protein n=1 Tax=Citricoccus sp. NR2 TaxID=3004095 RepID=UPI0022DD5F40|nr:hypothetical protein [Citricoccus sp. NR2]WBL19771.1 hypothetical protein O1A05_03490 [Citricoccus sp. NR2]